MKKKLMIWFGVVGMCWLFCLSGGWRLWMGEVYAAENDIRYTYDALGRVKTVLYQDGTKIEYIYDANGNIKECKKDIRKSPGGGTGENQPGAEQGSSTGGNQPGAEPGGSTEGNQPVTVPGTASQPPKITAADVKNYNRFKKKKPVIKSLKISESKKKYYLSIKIRQVNKRGVYGETIYQIRYASDSKFKKFMVKEAKRNKKGDISGCKWKVKKGKTYYVKVRAGLKTKTGRAVYTKYSKVKKIKVR